MSIKTMDAIKNANPAQIQSRLGQSFKRAIAHSLTLRDSIIIFPSHIDIPVDCGSRINSLCLPAIGTNSHKTDGHSGHLTSRLFTK